MQTNYHWGQTLVIVYVPQLEKVVLVKGYSPVQVSKKQEKKLISKEVAISTAMLDKGIEDVSKFKIKSIELVYSTRAVQFEADEPSMNPCWKINYSYPEMAEDDEGSIWIGIALLPASMLPLSHQLKACAITDADLTTEILLAWRKGRLPSELRDFLKMWDET